MSTGSPIGLAILVLESIAPRPPLRRLREHWVPISACLAQQHQPALRIVHCYHTSSSVLSWRPIPLRIHTHFDRLMAPTSLSPSPSPSLPPLWILLQVAASRSHIVHRVMGAVQSRRLPLIYHQSYIRARALVAWGRALFQHADGHQALSLVSSAHFSPHSWRSRGGRPLCLRTEASFFWLAPLLFASVGVASSCGHYLSALAHPTRLSAEVDGDGDDGDGNADADRVVRVDGDGVQAVVLPQPPPSSSLSHSSPPSPTPSPPPCLSSPVMPASTRCGMGRAGLELRPVRARTHALAEMEKRGCLCEHIPFLTIALRIALLVRGWRSMHTCYAWDADVGAGVHTCAYGASALVLAVARVIERLSDQGGGSVRIAAGVAYFFLCGYRGCAFRGSFVFGCALPRRGDGDGELARVRCECAYILLSPPFLFLATFLFKLGRIPVICTILFMPNLPSPIHIRTAIGLNETGS
ncbi:hypothetical protein B0H13DRAFT_2373113 [Mycena leptocephala]|nr:hypothetical protein B0H13DRAFT_2373113 [Mycena leptocephala]